MLGSRVNISILVLAGALALAIPVHAQPSADEILEAAGFSHEDKQRILAGEMVGGDVKAVSDRDLSVLLGFIVKTSPEDLAKQALAGTLGKTDEQLTARGDISAAGSLEDFARLRLVPGGAEVAKTYINASAGDKLNLGTDEIAAFNALKSQADATQAVEQQLHRMLLARYQAYRASGLGGIPPYDRGGKSADPAGDLRKASEAPVLQTFFPAVQRALMNYPKATVPGLAENFFWVNNTIDDQPTFALTHMLSAPEGAARIIIQRQFYVGRSYNVEQAIAGFLPVQQGTVVVYVNHTFTDQVSGFGGSAKRGIGRNLLASTLKKSFEKARAAAAKP
ncbi:MAG: hypothetical protein H6Q33_2974 [Deltaproteobacteria bacterium]|nr:hypothetical protein [Deltaproteobacteria bacterium]